MTKKHQLLLALSCTVIAIELFLLIYYRASIINWVSHNLWIVIIPFLKGIFKKLLVMKFLALIKAGLILCWHLSKLLLLKVLKTLTVRYGIFFSQNRWYWIRAAKVMFLRRGKQFFRATARFWSHYSIRAKWLILIAFFPAGLVLFFLGLSFNITRKTMVQKTQESAIFKAATTASNTNKGIRGWIQRLDKLTLKRIRDLTPNVKK
ncbi:MAG: hypothetical protein KTR16_01860 [Acidiferrobacterales bacterium]|nr:hypothetical protein [Acidiferrobacterales bacterium]